MSLPAIPLAQARAIQHAPAFANFEKVRHNYLIIRTLEAHAEDLTRPAVAYIRGRELFVIKPSNWKGFNFLRQIWYIFNRIIFRYQELDILDWTQHSLRNRTLTTFKTNAYLDWLAATQFLGEDKRQTITTLTQSLEKTQKELDKVTQSLEKTQKELDKVTKELEDLRKQAAIPV